MKLYVSPLALGFSLPAFTLLREPNDIATLSPLEPDPQILERWGCADEDPWAYFVERWILVSDFGIAQYGFSESDTSGGFRMVELFRKNRWRFRRLHVLTYTTRIHSLLQHSHCTLVSILFKTFAGVFFNPAVCKDVLITKFESLFGLVEQAPWRMPLFTRWIRTSTLKMYLAWLTRYFPRRTSSSRTFESRWIFHTLCLRRTLWWRSWLCRCFCTLIFDRAGKCRGLLSNTALKPANCQQSPCPLWMRRCSLWFLTKMFGSILPFLASKFRDLRSCSILLFTFVFILWQSGFAFFWWISKLYNANTVLSFSYPHILNLYRLSGMSSGGKCSIHNKNVVPSCVELLNVVISNGKQ